MKKYLRNIISVFCCLFFLTTTIFGQEEIIFSPADLEPHEDGYYLSGVDLDLDDDGETEHYSQCDDAYEGSDTIPQLNHQETGTQQNFDYMHCMIMPTCENKGTDIDPPVETGYIQMAPGQYLGTDSALVSSITSPEIINLESITLETSADVSINDNRKIPYFVEISTDGGETWIEDYYINDYVATQGGYRVTYDADNTDFPNDIEYFIEKSEETSIRIRILTNDVTVDRPNKGQYVKVHLFTIVAELAPESGISDLSNSEVTFSVQERNIISSDGAVSVYTVLGSLIGSGQKVTVPEQGIYIVKTSDGLSKKVFINE